MIRKKGDTVYHVSAGGFVMHKNKILLIKNYYHGGIIPPHGHTEKGERLLQTAQREICEETGYCHLEPIKKLPPVYYTYKSGKETHKKTEHRWLFKLTKNAKQKKLANRESQQLENRWYTIDGALRASTFENTKIHLRMIKEFLANAETKRKVKKTNHQKP